MSETNIASQGQRISEVSKLLDSVGARNLPAERNGGSLEPVSPRSPTTRSEVRKVPPPSSEELSAADMSPLAVQLKTMKLPELSPEFFQQGQALENQITAFWNRAQEFMDAADAARDANEALNLKMDAATIWGQARPLREQWDAMKAHFDNVENLKQVIEFQKSLLKKHGWMASKSEWNRCMKWAMKEFGCTEQEALWARPEEIAAGLDRYVAHCKQTGYKLGARSADSRVSVASVVATAKAEQKRGRLSKERQSALVSQLLSGAE